MAARTRPKYLLPYHRPVQNSATFRENLENMQKRANSADQLKIPCSTENCGRWSQITLSAQIMHAVFVQRNISGASPFPKSKVTGFATVLCQNFLQARCHCCHPNNSIKALKDNIPDWYYSLWWLHLHGSRCRQRAITPITMTVILTCRQHTICTELIHDHSISNESRSLSVTLIKLNPVLVFLNLHFSIMWKTE